MTAVRDALRSFAVGATVGSLLAAVTLWLGGARLTRPERAASTFAPAAISASAAPADPATVTADPTARLVLSLAPDVQRELFAAWRTLGVTWADGRDLPHDLDWLLTRNGAYSEARARAWVEANAEAIRGSCGSAAAVIPGPMQLELVARRSVLGRPPRAVVRLMTRDAGGGVSFPETPPEAVEAVEAASAGRRSDECALAWAMFGDSDEVPEDGAVDLPAVWVEDGRRPPVGAESR